MYVRLSVDMKTVTPGGMRNDPGDERNDGGLSGNQPPTGICTEGQRHDRYDHERLRLVKRQQRRPPRQQPRGQALISPSPPLPSPAAPWRTTVTLRQKQDQWRWVHPLEPIPAKYSRHQSFQNLHRARRTAGRTRRHCLCHPVMLGISV